MTNAEKLINAKKDLARIEAAVVNGPHDVKQICEEMRGKIDEVIDDLVSGERCLAPPEPGKGAK